MNKDYCPYWQNQFCMHKDYKELLEENKKIKRLLARAYLFADLKCSETDKVLDTFEKELVKESEGEG